MPLPAGLLLYLLLSGALVFPVFSLQFNFASPQQCSPLLLPFTDLASPPRTTPTSLAIIPSNSTAIVISLENIDITAMGVNFLPFASGTPFMLSLNDANGNNVINTSFIFSVLPSPNNNSTCLPGPQPSIFTLATHEISQCKNFTIKYDTTVASRAPSARLYNPGGSSMMLKVTSDDPTTGVAKYLMAYVFGRKIILALDDGNGTIQTTPVLLVQGNSSSPSGCLSPNLTMGSNSTASSASGISTASSTSSNTSSGTSALTHRLITIIGASVGGAAVLLAFCLTILFILDRRRYRRQVNQVKKSVSFSTDFFSEKGSSQVTRLGDSYPTEFVKIHVDTSDLSSLKGYYDKISLASWSQAVPEHQYSPPLSDAKLPKRPMNPFPPDSPDSFTIPQPSLLQPCTITRPFTSRHSEAPSDIPDDLLPPPMFTRSLSGRHLRAPSDVPADLNSRCSIVSSGSYYPSVAETETKVRFPAVFPQSLIPRVLLASPRKGV